MKQINIINQRNKEAKDSKELKSTGILPSLTSRKTVTIQSPPVGGPRIPALPTGNELEGQEQDLALTKSCFLSESEHEEMPEMFSLSTSSIMSYPALQITGSEWGGSASSLLQADLTRNQKLKNELSKLRLSDFFDAHGGPHFKRLSITFAVKQNRDVGSSFGSTGDLHATIQDLSQLQSSREEDEDPEDPDGTCILGSSKAFLAASEARARDVLLTREKAEALLKKVRDEERVRASDVNQRRLGLLFAEIPFFETALPNGVHIKDVMPADFLEEEEAAAKQLIERQNAFLADNKFIEGSQMAWLFTQTEVQSISKCLQRCTVSTRGVGTVSAGGMDRPTFCRMLFDLDLVGEKVPYFWAVALFDSMAQPMRLCPPSAHHAATAPVVSVVNRFRLISVMDVIIRQHFEAMNREDFLQRVKQYAKKLKVYCDAVPGSKRDSVEGPAAKQAESNQKSPPKGRAENGLTNSTRDRLISAMLIEPEVLHLVFCFQHPIQSLFDCYAPKGYMQFTDFWQFCVDFQLAPRFVTEQQLKKAYEAAECFIILPPRLVREPPRGAFKARGKKGSDGQKRSKAASSPMPASTPTQSQPSETRQEEPRERHLSTDSTITTVSEDASELQECETSFGAAAFFETLCRIAFLYLSFYGSTPQQSSSSYFKISWLLSYLRSMSFLMLDHMHLEEKPLEPLVGAAAVVSQLPALWNDLANQSLAEFGVVYLQPAPGPGNRKMLRRRSRQQNMAPRLKPGKQTKDAAQSLNKQKTLSNIREACKNLGKAALVVKKMTQGQKLSGVVPRKMDDSSSEEDIPQPAQSKRGLSNDVTKERIEALTTRVAASFQKPKKQKKTETDVMPLDDLFKVEGSLPAVVNGVCQLCERSIQEGHFGNPACRGCSIVDSISLQAHPFARLLYLDSNPYGNAKLLRPKVKPQMGERLRPAFQLPRMELPRIESQTLLD